MKRPLLRQRLDCERHFLVLVSVLCWFSNFPSPLDYLLCCFSSQRRSLFPLYHDHVLVLVCFPFKFNCFFFSFSFCAVQLSHCTHNISLVIYFHGCFVDLIFLLFFKSIHAWCTHTLYSPSTDSFFSSARFSSLSLSNSSICNFIMIITPSNIYYYHLGMKLNAIYEMLS